MTCYAHRVQHKAREALPLPLPLHAQDTNTSTAYLQPRARAAPHASPPHRPAAPLNPATSPQPQTWAGTIGCAIGAFVASVPEVLLFSSLGFFGTPLTTATICFGCFVCAVLTAVVESLPLGETDNITIPLAVALVAPYVF